MTGTTETTGNTSTGIFAWLANAFSTTKRKVITDICIILIPIILICYFLAGTKTPPEVKQALKDNQKIETSIDSLKEDNKFIMSRMYVLEANQASFSDSINKTNNLIQENNKQLSKLKRIYNEKITTINGYNISQLDSFFTSRYKDYYNR